jgi:hypothetical protein
MSLPDWKCWCGEPADYKFGREYFCGKHWNHGDPVKPTLKDIVSRETRETNGK